jgi:hypothetical protein
MIFIETPKKPVDDEVAFLYAQLSDNVPDDDLKNAFVAGAITSLVWLRDGLPKPSEQIPDFLAALKEAGI